MLLDKIQVGMNRTNCYLFSVDEERGLVVDPGGDADKILSSIDKSGIKVAQIIITHGHFDHIGALDLVREQTGAEVAIHRLEADFLTRAEKNLSTMLGIDLTMQPADRLLTDGDLVGTGGGMLKVIHTPGHSPGSISLYCRQEGIVFSGDVIFSRGTGRSDFPGCSRTDLEDSIKKLLELPDDTVVYPGHGIMFTIRDFADFWSKTLS